MHPPRSPRIRVTSSPFYAFAALLSLGACGAAAPFRTYPADESARVAEAPWPRLADGPTRREAVAAAPEPLTGAAIVAELRGASAAAEARRTTLGGPVTDAAALGAQARAQRARAESLRAP